MTTQQNIKKAESILNAFCEDETAYSRAVMGNISMLRDCGAELLEGYFNKIEILFGDDPRDWEFVETPWDALDPDTYYTESGCKMVYENEADCYMAAYRDEMRNNPQYTNAFAYYGVKESDFY